MKRLLSAVALSALMAGAALAAEPITLSDGQMDGVTAGFSSQVGAMTSGSATSNNVAASSSTSAYAEAQYAKDCGCAVAQTNGFAGKLNTLY